MSRVLLGLVALLVALPAVAQEGVFLTEAEAPRAVFPDADRVTPVEVEVTDALRARVAARLDGHAPTLWEDRYPVFRAERAGTTTDEAGTVVISVKICACPSFNCSTESV